jgi:hypothetical protein
MLIMPEQKTEKPKADEPVELLGAPTNPLIFISHDSS